MDINPYDNFDNWSCILLNTLQCSQDYLYLMPDCIDLIFSIISDNQLPDPITSYTNNFLNQILPEATSYLLKIMPTNDEEIETCMSFLTTMLTLCTWAVQNNVESLFRLPSLILDKHQFFYGRNTENWKTIVDNFLSSGDLSLVCSLMTQTNPFPSLNIYTYVIKILLVLFKNRLYNDVSEYIDQFTTSFGNYLRSIMDLQIIRNIDKNAINTILDNFYKILEDTSFNHTFELSAYYDFFDFCIKSEIIFIQLFIIKNFQHFLIYANKEVILQFKQWCQSKNFIDFLISKDFNEEVIKQMGTLFVNLADKDLLSKNTLYALWNRTLHVHTSQRKSYIILISRILWNMKSKEALRYLTIIMKNGNKDFSEEDIAKYTNDTNEDNSIEDSTNELIPTKNDKIINDDDNNNSNGDFNNNNDNSNCNNNDNDTFNDNDYISNNNDEINSTGKISDIINNDETNLNDNNYNDNNDYIDNNNNSDDFNKEVNDIINKIDASNQEVNPSNETQNQKVVEFEPINNKINHRTNSDEVYQTNIRRNNKIEHSRDFISIDRYYEICDQLKSYNITEFQITNEILQLLLSCLCLSKSKLSYFVITILFEFSKNDEKVANEFKKATRSFTRYKSILFLFYKCFHLIQESPTDHHIASIFLPNLICSVEGNIDLGVDFERCLFKTLRYDRTLIYSIISEYYQRNYKHIPFQKIIDIYADNHDFDDEFWNFMKSLLDTNGINATDDDGFNQLKECIDEFDFRKATTTFVYFLKSYYFIINFYEGKMKTDDFRKQTVSGPIVFYKSDTPPLGLDQFFKLLEMTEDEHVVSITTSIILLFITSYESFNYDDPISTIQDIILPKIKSEESNSMLVKRYLKVLLEVSRNTEYNLNLSDYGFPKHSIYKDDILVLLIHGLDVCQTLICDKHETFYNVQDRLVNLYSYLKDEHLFFRYNGSLIHDESLPLSFHSFENNHPLIEISNLENKIEKDVDKCKKLAPNCPSLFLTKQGFQSLLLSFYNTPELSYIVNEFLNFLPNDPETINLINDNELFISKLLKNDNSYAFQYHLQDLISTLRITSNEDLINQYKNVDFLTFLCQILKDHEDCSYEIISLLNCLFSPDLQPIIEDLISIVCNILSANSMDLLDHSLSETKAIASQLFHSILLTFPDVTILANNPSLFESIVLNASPETWQQIRNGLYNLTNIMPLFDKLIDHISSLKESSTTQPNSKYFTELFTAYVPRVSNKCNISKILDMCIDILSSPAVFEQTNDDNQSIVSLCEMTSSILDANKDIEFSNLSDVISKTLPIALETSNEKKQNAIYNLCLSLATHISDGQNQINKIMKSIYDIQTDRWNYKPNNFTKSSTGFVGLTNLGATCYMNSVLQQLFFFKPFRDSVLIEKYDDEKEGKDAFLEFQKIFSNLLLSKKSFADTRPFCSTWKGWFKSVINVREQQDAVEFVNMFLDQLPESLKTHYKGTIVNQIEGISEEFTSSNLETFFAFPLEIKNFTTMEESFDNFLQDELFTGENQITADTLDHKIDARKYSRIQTAPPVLIIQLKRFAYDIRTLNRIKIYSRFVIPQTINIKKLLANNDDMIYELKGVVLHYGNANGGHYTSLIKINENFYDFNDMNVSLFNMNDFERNTFGGNQQNSCAYLLFYERKENTKENDGINANEAQLVPSEIREEIEKENNDFVQCQCAFAKPTMHFASYCNDVLLMTNYYINVFLHSGLGDESHVISERLKSCISSNFQEKWFIQHLIDIFNPKITEFFTCCSNEDIMNSFIDIITMIIETSNIKLKLQSKNEVKEEVKEEEKDDEDDDELKEIISNDSDLADKNDPIIVDNEINFVIDDSEMLLLFYQLADMIIKFSSSVEQWRQYKYLFKIPLIIIQQCNLSFLLNGTFQRIQNEIHDDVKITIHDQDEDISNRIDISSWPTIITDVITNFYKNNNSEVVFENVNFSTAFKVLQQICKDGVESPIMDYYSKIIMSKENVNSFFIFALKTHQPKFDIESGFTYFYCDQFNMISDKEFIKYMKHVLSLTDFNPKFYMFDKDHLSLMSEICNMFNKQINLKKNERLRLNLVHNYKEFVYPYLVVDSDYFIREKAANLTLDMFPNLQTIEEIRPSYRNYNKKFSPPSQVQIEELKLIWNQLLEKVDVIASEPTKYIDNYDQNKKNYVSSEFAILKCLYVMKWIMSFIQLDDQNQFNSLLNLFKKFSSLSIQNNTILPVVSEILFSYPKDFWLDDSVLVAKEALLALAPPVGNSDFQQLLPVIATFSEEKIDELFNDQKCIEKLIEFFTKQGYSTGYNTFEFLKAYLARNPQKISLFFVIFDFTKYSPEDFCENMKCILDIPNAEIPAETAYKILADIVKYLSKEQISFFDGQNTLRVFRSLRRYLADQIPSEYDFNFINRENLRNLMATVDSASYQTTELLELIELLCSIQKVRQFFFEFVQSRLSRMTDYHYSFIFLLNVYTTVIFKFSDDQESSKEANFLSNELIASILEKRRNSYFTSNVFSLITRANDVQKMKELLKAILENINVYERYNSQELLSFVVQMIQSVGVEDVKEIVSEICMIEDEEKHGIDNRYVSNLALVIGVFPEVLAYIRENHRDAIPPNTSIISTRIEKAFYPEDV